MLTLQKDQMVKLISDLKPYFADQEAGFVAYSSGQCVMPMPGHLHFEQGPGDLHLKFGLIRGGDSYVVKAASGVSANSQKGLPTGDGFMALFSTSTGLLSAMLFDRGYLTDVRTAIAGAIVAKYLAPKKIETIGIVGTGVQAQMQLEYLKQSVDCRDVLVWGRRPSAVADYIDKMADHGFRISACTDLKALTRSCQFIVTATNSNRPLLHAEDVRPGTHVTAMGADNVGKQELAPQILKNADRVIVDSLAQCRAFGELSHLGQELPKSLHELGAVISNPRLGRQSESEITVADLTGLAVQDLQICRTIVAQNNR